MFEFLSNEVFQIIVVSALVFLCIMVFYTFKLQSKTPDIEKLTNFMDDVDYRLDRINTKMNDLMNTLMNGMLINDDEDSDVDNGISDNYVSSEPTVNEQTVEEPTVGEPTVNEQTVEEPTVGEPTVGEPTGGEAAVGEAAVNEEVDNKIFEDNLSSKLIVDTITNHINMLNYDGLEFSDIPNTIALESNDTSVVDEEELVTEKKVTIIKRIINQEQ